MAIEKKGKKVAEQACGAIIVLPRGLFSSLKGKRQYDKFLHEIQKEKMKELWDNPADASAD